MSDLLVEPANKMLPHRCSTRLHESTAICRNQHLAKFTLRIPLGPVNRNPFLTSFAVWTLTVVDNNRPAAFTASSNMPFHCFVLSLCVEIVGSSCITRVRSPAAL